MSITQECALTCVECSEPIAEGSVYFWGRHGGEWHPKCFAELGRNRLLVTGVWRNQAEPFTDPLEYAVALLGFEQGAGI